MTMLADDRLHDADPVDGDDDDPRRRRAWWTALAQAPLWAHAIALAVVLLVGCAVTRPSWPSISDEGAALAQVDSLAAGDGWLTEHPYPAVDPNATAFPIDLSSHEAGTDLYAPLAKHPLYATLLVLPYRLGGVAGTFLVSVAGTVLAALAAALLGRRIEPRVDRLTLWLTGLATPLLYDSYLVIAHTLGAACVGFAVLLLTRPKSRTSPSGRRRLAIAGGLVFLVLAELLRNEAVLLGLALSAAFVLCARRGSRRRGYGLGAAVFAATVFGYRLDAALLSVAVGKESAPFTIASQGDLVTQRWVGFFNSTLRLPDSTGVGRLLLAASAVLVILAASRCARRDGDPRVASLFAAAALCAAAAYVTNPGDMVFGLVFAAPVLIAGWVMLDRATLHRALPSLLAVTGLLFALAVFATQYADAGNAWGGRYLAVGLPVVTPLAAVGIFRGLQNLPRSSRTVSTLAMAVIVVALAAGAVTSLYEEHVYVSAVQQLTVDATRDDAGTGAPSSAAPGDGDPRPVVLATEKAFGRLLWSRVREERWLTATGDDVPVFAHRLRDAGVRRLVVVTADPALVIAQLEPWYSTSDGAQRVKVSFPLRRDAAPQPAVIVFIAR
jgi:hypothetical protein